ncbi:MAG: polyprenyl synthetase family protein [Bifidobacterium aquikefiri]|uniref:Serralysin n=1 Tax=Bifidobacterium aquikefiri TaxID=1653207 RepID=A0A261G6A8_9BIFI|nr:polyprenyl synthetase family protein [Bifidobacterium aquikefiri]OZG66735.1 serralysin [Bifidobacterium aquikefiri]
MTIPDDIAAINHRISFLVDRHLGAPAGTGIPRSCQDIYDAVICQGQASNEGGKRLRARLLLSIYDAIQGTRSADRDAVMDVACAIEVFQTAALVHDDIIDNSHLRRGKPSAHVALTSALARMATAEDPANALPSAVEHIPHIGAGLGIMLGDLLSTASIDIVNAISNHMEHGDGVLEAFLNMHREVEIGQVLDLAVEQVPLNDPHRLAEASLAVFRWKTASYTTVAPLTIGMLAAGADPHNAAAAIGTNLGTAFQLADDLLDIIGDPARIGKPTGGDIREGKRTVLLSDALNLSNQRDRSYLINAFTADHRDEGDVREITRIFKDSGAFEASRKRISYLWFEAQHAINRTAHKLQFSEKACHDVIQCCSLFIPEALR